MSKDIKEKTYRFILGCVRHLKSLSVVMGVQNVDEYFLNF